MVVDVRGRGGDSDERERSSECRGRRSIYSEQWHTYVRYGLSCTDLTAGPVVSLTCGPVHYWARMLVTQCT